MTLDQLRPIAGALLAPLRLIGFLGYVVVATHHLAGWFWVERHVMHMTFDWGRSTLHQAKAVLLGSPSVAQILVVGTVIAAVLLALPVARLLAPLRTAVLVPLVGVLTVATTWFCLYVTVIAKWTP